MLIIPAIDLQNGRCVRLQQGQFDKVAVFDNSPLAQAAWYQSLGAKRLHIVDLDGAQQGSMQQLPLISSLQKTGIDLQVGGGIRTLEQAKRCFDIGISQLVLGSIAITKPTLCQQIITEIGANNIVLALDVRIENTIPIPALHGWQSKANTSLWQLVSDYQPYGITQILCTDIACDGMMQGPNFALYEEAVKRFPSIYWQASGGIRNSIDLAKLDELGVHAAILGLTLYQGNFNLSECLKEYG